MCLHEYPIETPCGSIRHITTKRGRSPFHVYHVLWCRELMSQISSRRTCSMTDEMLTPCTPHCFSKPSQTKSEQNNEPTAPVKVRCFQLFWTLEIFSFFPSLCETPSSNFFVLIVFCSVFFFQVSVSHPAEEPGTNISCNHCHMRHCLISVIVVPCASNVLWEKYMYDFKVEEHVTTYQEGFSR